MFLVAGAFLTTGFAASQITGQVDDRTIRDASIEGALVTDSRVEDTRIEKATVRDSQLEDVRVRSATVEDSTVEGSDIRDATVRRSTLSDTTLHGVTVIDSDLTRGRVEKALVEGGSLRGVTVVDSTLDDVDRTGGSYCRVFLRDEGRHLNSGCNGRDEDDDRDDDDDDTPTPTGRRIVLRNGGAGPNYDRADDRGKYFPDAAPGTITEVCVWAAGAGRRVDAAITERPDRAFPEWRGTFRITSQTPQWYCLDTNEPFGGDSLFIYRTGGDASVGWQRDTNGDSYASRDGGRTWTAEPGVSRGYRVTIET